KESEGASDEGGESGGGTMTVTTLEAEHPAEAETHVEARHRPVRKPPTHVEDQPVTTPTVTEPVVRETPQVVTDAPVATPEVIAPPVVPPAAPVAPPRREEASPTAAPRVAAEAP